MVVPLLFINFWDHVTEYSIGKSQLKINPYDYLKAEFENGLIKNGYEVTDDSADIELKVRPNQLMTKSKYERKGYVIFVMFAVLWGGGDTDGPYESAVLITVKETKNNQVTKKKIEASNILNKNDFGSQDNETERAASILSLTIHEAVMKYLEEIII